MSKISVVGSYAVGLVMTAERVPMAGETIKGKTFEETHGGKGSNQAVASSRLGADSAFIACVGDDHYGEEAIELHNSEEVNTEFLTKDPDLSTGAGFIIVEEGGENSIIVTPGANSALNKDRVKDASEVIRSSDVLLTQLEIPLETALYAGKLASDQGVKSVLNPAPAPSQEVEPEKLSRFDLVTPNYTEACALAGVQPDKDVDPEELLGMLSEKGASAVLMTLGSEGALLRTDEVTMEVEAPDVTAVDTTGAGDVFNAALAVALAEGKGLENGEAIEFAGHAGALAVTKKNVIPSIPSRKELEDFISKNKA